MHGRNPPHGTCHNISRLKTTCFLTCHLPSSNVESSTHNGRSGSHLKKFFYFDQRLLNLSPQGNHCIKYPPSPNLDSFLLTKDSARERKERGEREREREGLQIAGLHNSVCKSVYIYLFTTSFEIYRFGGGMSETKYSSSSSPADSWAHEFYNPNIAMLGGGRDRVSSEATVISTTASGSATSNIPSHHGSSSSNPSGQYLNMPADQGAGGRAPKPVRRRSRASRRTPTTLLNTDTTNFRAMVQQFTGGPAMPYATGSHPQYPFPRGGSNFSFGVESRNQILNPTPSSGAFYQLQLQQQQQQQQQQREQHQHEPYYQQQHQPYMFSFMNNSRPDMEDMNNQAAGGFSIDHVPFPDLPHPRPPSSMPR